ncbi:MAG: stage II sporulation protein M [Oscillospiraceae bacterium]|nr:stage II sporulation protein M [Oscillospiraceae bacterium]
MVARRDRAKRLPSPSSQGLRLLFFCGFFVFGAMIGHIAARLIGNDFELEQALLTLASQETETADPSPWKVLAMYFRFPLLAFLLGFCTFAMAAIPVLMAIQGFSLSFAASALVMALGSDGIPLVLASFGLRSVIAIVCTLLIGMWSLCRVASDGGKEQHTMRLFGICFFLLLIGMILELTIMPALFSGALGRLEVS